MRKIALFAAASAAALTLAACSEATQDAAEATGDEMAADAEANMEAVEATADEAMADVAAEADRRNVKTELNDKRDDVAEVAILDI